MKKIRLFVLLFSLIFVAGCDFDLNLDNELETEVSNIQEYKNQVSNSDFYDEILINTGDEISVVEDFVDEVLDEEIKDQLTLGLLIEDSLKNIFSCDNGSEMFINYAILGTGKSESGNVNYYIVANGQGYYVDERGNLNNDCGVGHIPITLEISKNESRYNLENYIQAEDGSNYKKSVKKMFSKKAYTNRVQSKYVFLNKSTILSQAESYFNKTIIPKSKKDFDCDFCDKLRYYDNSEDGDKNINSNDLLFNYTTEDNKNNTIYFGSDGKFEAKGSWDEGVGYRYFGKNKDTVIVLNTRIPHVYDRYIITDLTEDRMSTILEIIQNS